MNPAEVLSSLVNDGCALWIDEDRLGFLARAAVMTPERRQAVRAVRDGVRALLATGAGLPALRRDWPGDAVAAWDERAGIIEFQGGLAREVAELDAERLVRVEHARSFLARHGFVATAPAAAVAGERSGSGPHR